MRATWATTRFSVELVERLREDPAPRVRRSAAYAPGNIRPASKLALSALVEVASDPDELPGIRQGAIASLRKVGAGSKRVVLAIEKAAHDPDVTFFAVQTLVALGADEKAEAFLAHRDERVRTIAGNAYTLSGGANVSRLNSRARCAMFVWPPSSD